MDYEEPWLDLSGSQLETVPTVNAKRLKLARNALTSVEGTWHSLDVSANRVSTLVVNCVELDASSNRLTDIQISKSIVDLRLADNALTTIDFLKGFPALRSLNVARNDLARVPKVPNLTELDVSDNRIRELEGPSIDVLDISNNGLGLEQLQSLLKGLPKLVEVHCEHTDLDYVVIVNQPRPPNLKELQDTHAQALAFKEEIRRVKSTLGLPQPKRLDQALTFASRVKPPTPPRPDPPPQEYEAMMHSYRQALASIEQHDVVVPRCSSKPTVLRRRRDSKRLASSKAGPRPELAS